DGFNFGDGFSFDGFDFGFGIPYDDYPDVTDITLPATINGTINRPDWLFGPDTDTFEFTASAGDVIRWSLTDIQADLDLVAFVVYSGDDEAGADYFRLLTELTPGVTRQALLPWDGTYQVTVGDYNNFFASSSEPLIGGDAYTWTLNIATESVTATGELLPIENEENSGLLPQNPVRVLDLTALTAGILVVNVDAFTLDTPSDLDVDLVLMNSDYTQVLAMSDNDGVSVDPAFSYALELNQNVKLVIDYSEIGANNPYTLNALLADAGTEYEPNGGVGSAWPLTVDGDPVNGGIGPVDESDDGNFADYDFYRIGELEAGDTVEITVEPAAESEVEPFVYFGNGATGSFSTQWLTEHGPDGDARLVATALTDGIYYVIVADARNLPPADAEDDWELVDGVGSESDHGYIVSVVSSEWDVTSLGGSFPLGYDETLEPGDVHWYPFSPGTLNGEDAENFYLLTAETSDDSVAVYFDLFNQTGTVSPTGVRTARADTDTNTLTYTPSTSTPFEEAAVVVWNVRDWPETNLEYSFTVDAVSIAHPTELTYEEDDFETVDVEDFTAGYVGYLFGTVEVNVDIEAFEFDAVAGDLLVIYGFNP
ncbi:MAG: hypothetical protein KC561_15985, partial [Myxococcales bacterium]|nr:hypothetical protein [Myxococcales bacterium]